MEIVNTYPLDNPEKLIPMNRDEFYASQIEEFKNNGSPSCAVEVINVFLFNEAWEFIIQKRASKKAHNANLMDKSIWWHITNWDNPDFTVMVESVQELQVPSIVLRSHADFLKTYYLLSGYMTSTAVIEHLDTLIIHVPKVIKWEKIVIANKTHVYMWVYWGSVKNVDKEAKWVLFYSLKELEEEMHDFPDTFTEDLHFYLKKYKWNFKEFISTIQNK